jgi:pilus assembly protein CpaB
VILATLGTFVVLSYVRGAEQRAIAGEETVDVLVVAEPIQRGAQAAALEASIETVQVPAKIQVDGSVTSLEQLEGLVAAVDLVPGEQLLSTRFVGPEALQIQSRFEPPEGLLEVTLSLSPDRAVGGQPIPGETVAVVASFDPFTLDATELEVADESLDIEQPVGENNTVKTPNTTGIILHKALVTNVQVGELVDNTSDEPDLIAPDLAPTGNLLVTLALDAPSVERALFAAEHGTVWLVLEPETAPEDGTQIQTIVSVYE